MELGIILDQLLIYIPLGIIGLWRWSTWVFKKLCALRYNPILADDSFTENSTLSIVIPVYNENPEIFEEALNSWGENKPDEIIAVIDEMDKTCIEIFERFSKKNPSAILLITKEPGKRPALVKGIRKATSEFVALVDSDVIWDNNVKTNALAPFVNPKIGGVVARQNVISGSSGILQKMTDILWDLRNADEWPSQVAMGKVVTCLSGRTAFYRREIILPHLDEFLNEIIFGRKKESGDDKCLTRIIQRNGWNTYFQSSAQVYSTAVPDIKTFFSQRIRWTRNSFNSDIVSLFKEKWAWKHPYLAFYMLDRFVSPFTILLAPIFFGIAIYSGHWFVVATIAGWWIVSRGIKTIPYLRRKPKDVLILPIYTVVNFLTAVAKIYAIVTIREQKWIRGIDEREIKGGNLKRTMNLMIPVFITGGIICGIALLAISTVI